jgi:hypothetical protein
MITVPTPPLLALVVGKVEVQGVRVQGTRTTKSNTWVRSIFSGR